MKSNLRNEIKSYLEQFRKLDNTYRTKMYEGMLCLYRGDREGAFAYWQRMEEEFPLEWHVYLVLGDMHARSGAYDKAKSYYQKALENQPVPHYCDPYDSIAQVCELQGNYREAIETLKEELEILDSEWDSSIGETSDAVRRNIVRLEKKLQ